ncbi:capsular biosynthesis protein [Vibrio makurazakiensis]|uniref:capsular biosynthesis protein n=1 Tax=Vibrio makurazakiensis TaxID=2910250 RepID=UPI003D1249DF
MFLIMSAAYIGQELESEFGKIPPSFLPLGNRRLFQHQILLAPERSDVYLSIPESFLVSDIDAQWLESNNVTLIKTPDGLNLGASLVAALNLSGHSLDTPLHILYGDTLFKQLPTGDDVVSISEVKDSYNWAVLTDDDVHWLKDRDNQNNTESHRIVDGYFKFSHPRDIIKCVTQSEWNFLEGLNKYHQIIGLTPIQSDGWLDFGHVNTYYRSKADFTTQRAFNELTINSKWIEKSSIKSTKIAAEANWFSELPFSLKGNTPQFLGATKSNDGKVSYRLEYLHLTALNELFVFSKLPSNIWQQILTCCIEFLALCSTEKSPKEQPSNQLDELFSKKTQSRLHEYCQGLGISQEQEWIFNDQPGVSLTTILKDSESHLPAGNSIASVLHGDFCFSNILYDFRAGKVKTIDPRGMTPDETLTIYGDIQYDIAKLSHSILGLYDWIIAGYFHVEIDGSHIKLDIAEENQHRQAQQMFIDLIEKQFDLSAQSLYAMQIQLFLSMLPLHADDPKRQQALFANAFRLHQILKRLEQ